jgi:hypothetical protein
MTLEFMKPMANLLSEVLLANNDEPALSKSEQSLCLADVFAEVSALQVTPLLNMKSKL